MRTITHAEIEVTGGAPEAAALAACGTIDAKRCELQRAFDDAVELHERAVDASNAAADAVAKLKRVLGAASGELAEITRETQSAEAAGIDDALIGAAAEGGRLNISTLVKVENLRVRHRAVVRFCEVITEERLPLAEEMVMAARVEELLAQASRIERLADKRQMETELYLAAIAAEEGDAVLDESKTRTGMLRQEAARLTLEAGKLSEQLDARRRERIEAADRRALSFGR